MSAAIDEATPLIHILRYGFRAKVCAQVILVVWAMVFAASSYGNLQLGWFVLPISASAALFFFLALRILVHPYDISGKWLYVWALLCSLPLWLIVLIAAVGDRASAIALVPTGVLCLLFLVMPASRSWKAARLLGGNGRWAALTRARAKLLDTADRLQSHLASAANAMPRHRNRTIGSSMYFRSGRLSLVVWGVLVTGVYVLDLSRALPQLRFLQDPEQVGYAVASLLFPSALVFVVWVLSLPLLLLSAILLAQAHRRAALEADALRQLDSRSPVLLLRSFADDTMRLSRSRLRRWLAMIDPRRTRGLTLEHVVSHMLLPFGPIVAIGEPHETLPPLGAARAYYHDMEWHDAVRGLMREARLILVIVHSTPNLLWELDALVAEGMLGKTVLLFPPVKPKELAARWLGVVSHLGTGAPGAALQAIDPRRILVARFGNDGGLIAWEARERSIWAYDACLTLGLELEMSRLPAVDINPRRAKLLRHAWFAAVIPVASLVAALLEPRWVTDGAPLERAERVVARYESDSIGQLAGRPYFRIVFRNNEALRAKEMSAAILYDLDQPLKEDLIELLSRSRGTAVPDKLRERLDSIALGTAASALRVALNAQDELLRVVAGRAAVLLAFASDAEPVACAEFLTTGNRSLLVKMPPTVVDDALNSLEAAYLDGRRRPSVRTPVQAEAQPLMQRLMGTPNAFQLEELDAVARPDAALPNTLCRAYAKLLHNISMATPSDAATALRYINLN